MKNDKDKGIIIDIGTGDGKFIYNLAKQYPNRFFIGIDPNHKGVINQSAKIYKKPAKGGLNNILYVLASVEDLPDELNDSANQIFIILPWGSLLDGIVKVRKKVFRSIQKIAKKRAQIDIVLGYEKTAEGRQIDLPEINLNYINNKMRYKLENLSFKIKEIKEIDKQNIKEINTSWAKKLSFGKNRSFFYISLSKDGFKARPNH